MYFFFSFSAEDSAARGGGEASRGVERSEAQRGGVRAGRLGGSVGGVEQGRRRGGGKRTPSASVHMSVSVPRLAEGDIPPGTRPDFIPSDHVHPLFISPTHSPQCHNMIHSCPPPTPSTPPPPPSPALPPPSKPRQSPQNPPVPPPLPLVDYCGT